MIIDELDKKLIKPSDVLLLTYLEKGTCPL